MSASWPYLWDGCRDGALALAEAQNVAEPALDVVRFSTAQRDGCCCASAHDWGVRYAVRVSADVQALFELRDYWVCRARPVMCRKA